MRVSEIVSQLTLQEKAHLVIGLGAWHTHPVERLGIPSLTVCDGPNGVRLENKDAAAEDKHNKHQSYPATCFPTLSALAATFNRDVLYSVGKQLAEEAAHYAVNVLLGPGVNHKRSPLGGRNFEYFSEDPVLTAGLATAYVRGLQDHGVSAAVKHFFGNNTEYRRFDIDIRMGERALKELYLKAFAAIIKDAKPDFVMSAYNRYNGKFCSESVEVMEDILRDELGFEGVTVSDWCAVHNIVEAMKNGLSLEMGFDHKDFIEQIVANVESGEIPQEKLDKACERILQIVVKNSKKKPVQADFEKGYQIALKAAEESAVLLKNDGVLPLKGDFCVIGYAAKYPRYQGEGSSRVNACRVTTPYGELVKIYGDIEYAEGYTYTMPLDEAKLREAREVAARHKTAVLFIANDDYSEEESMDRTSLFLKEKHLRIIDEVAKVNTNLVVVLQTGSVTDTSYSGKVKGLVQQYFTGEACGEAIAKLLSGKIDFSGRTAETYPHKLEDNPSHPYYAYDPNIMEYKEGIFTGYRYYDTFGVPVKYPFGYGLSYSEIVYENVRVVREVENIRVCVRLKNNSQRAAKESVLLFVSKPSNDVKMPKKELLAFEKTELGSGEGKEVVFTIPVSELWYWNEETHAREIAKGKYGFCILTREGQTICAENDIDIQ